jgi:hypothetical protein
VKSLLSLLLLTSLVLASAGCGNVFVRGVFDPGVSSISGSVSIVQLTIVTGDNGTSVQVTLVTFLQNGFSSSMGFCGDQRSQFPINQTVRADFHAGQTCANIVAVVIL